MLSGLLKCEVFGTRRDLSRVQVILQVLGASDKDKPELIFDLTRVLSVRARKRLERMIVRGLTPPARGEAPSESRSDLPGQSQLPLNGEAEAAAEKAEGLFS